MIYLDNSATSYPKPKSVIKTINDQITYFGANPGRSGYKMGMDTSEQVFLARKKLANLYNFSKVENVIFTSGCTQAINIVLKGLLKEGDNVVITSLEHNAVVRPLQKLSEEKNVSFTIAKVFIDDDEKTVQSIKNCLKGNTKLVFCTHASNVFGCVLPVEKIYSLCSQNNIKMAVDVAQTAGIVSLDLQKYPIDYICGAGHKGLYGTMGVGFLLVKDEIGLNTIIEGGTGSLSDSIYQPQFMPDKFESGTGNILGILSLSSGVDFVQKTGLKKIQNHEVSLIKFFYDSLKQNDNVIFYTQPKLENSVGVLSFNIKNKTSEEVGEMLAKNGICVRCGLHCASIAHKYMGTNDNGTVRMSTSVFNSKNNIEKLVQYVNYLAK